MDDRFHRQRLLRDVPRVVHDAGRPGAADAWRGSGDAGSDGRAAASQKTHRRRQMESSGPPRMSARLGPGDTAPDLAPDRRLRLEAHVLDPGMPPRAVGESAARPGSRGTVAAVEAESPGGR